MIKIKSKQDCCGCSACVSSCPKKCIGMIEDDEGFIYPNVEIEKCIDCHLCEKVCPILNRKELGGYDSQAFAAYNLDEEERMNSSSGGIFSLLANQILTEEGVVYGVAMSNDCSFVRHIRVESKNELNALKGSKYLQSRIGTTYEEIKNDLKKNKKVLFSGTPCQIAGLKSYLKNDYDNLFCIDVVCHGVPSEKLWRKYLCFHEKESGATVQQVFFRYKYYGWKMYSLCLNFSTNKKYKKVHYNDIFMQLFLQNNCLRPSCYSCAFKGKHDISDISLADFWGAESICPEMDDDKGLSLVIVHNKKGDRLFQKINDNIISKKVDLNRAIALNPAVEKSCSKPDVRNDFMKDIDVLTIKELKSKYIKKKSMMLQLRIWMSINVKKRFRRMLSGGN